MRRCASCTVELERVNVDYPSRRVTDKPNYKDALHVSIRGGFGEFVDGSASMIICHSCTIRLINSVPWIADAVHRTEENPLSHIEVGSL